jgi:hypothetical protein
MGDKTKQDEAMVSLLEQTMADLGPKLAEKAKEAIADDIARRMGWAASEIVQDFVKTWIAENIIPEVARQLEADRPQMIAQILAGFHAATRQLALGIEAAAVKNCANSWALAKLIKELID